MSEMSLEEVFKTIDWSAVQDWPDGVMPDADFELKLQTDREEGLHEEQDAGIPFQPETTPASDVSIIPAIAPSAAVIQIVPEWPEPAPRYVKPVRPPAPAVPLDVLPLRLAKWVREAADSKGAPPDYVLAVLLAIAASAIGNARHVSPWQGWTEPPVIWAMVIGQPSASKSPGLDAALAPLRQIEKAVRRVAEAEYHEWEDKRDIAKLAESAWNKSVKAAIAEGGVPPDRPAQMQIPPAPHVPRYIVNDATIEKLGVILAAQPRCTLQLRDELAGWLDGMQRYSSGSDRPFWLEAFGGRSYTVERMGREPLTVDRLAISVVGGIQPDRLKTLLFTSDDDGLLARFIPVWPDPVPVKMPDAFGDDTYIRKILLRLFSLEMEEGCDSELIPVVVNFTSDAQTLLNDFRVAVREEENKVEGLLLSFLGKLSGLAVRLSLILAALDWADGQTRDLEAIGAGQFERALRLVWDYILPMARRAYADAAMSGDDRKALRLVQRFREKGMESFTSREILRAGLAGMSKAADLNPVLAALEDGEVIRPVEGERPPQGGRPVRR